LFKQPSSNKFQAEKIKSLEQTCSNVQAEKTKRVSQEQSNSNFEAEKTTPWNSQGSSSSRQEKLLDKNNKLVSRQRERARERRKKLYWYHLLSRINGHGNVHEVLIQEWYTSFQAPS
jgi:hypothetical protein